jgi:hypothetical protein
MMARLLLYGYCLGVTSSRKIEKATHEDVAFRYLAADQHPDHDTIASYRQENVEDLAGIFVQVLRLCQKAGLVKLGNIAIDGTKMLANASTRRSVPYAKLAEREKHWLEEVERLLREAREKDQEEDARYGKGQTENPLPAELAHAQSRLQRIQAAKAALEKEAQAQLQAASENYIPGKRGRPRKEGQPAAAATSQTAADERKREKDKIRYRRAKKNAQQPSRQYNFVDPDSRVMKDNRHKYFVQGYNAQAAVDTHAQVVVAAEITQQTNDTRQLLPLVQSACANVASRPQAVTADTGYWDTESLCDPTLQGIQLLVSPDAKPQAPDAALAPSKPQNEVAVGMREVLSRESGKALYAMRKVTVEPVFGQIKEVRGIRRFRFRGLQQVAAEWKIICTTHNLLKLFRHRAGVLAASGLPAVAGTAMASCGG